VEQKQIIKKVSAMRAEKERQMGGSKAIPEAAFRQNVF
jgi:hypothetical protein